MFDETIQKLRAARIIPLAAVDDEDAAVQLCRALSAGGMKTIEIAFRPSAHKRGGEVTNFDAVARCIARCAAQCPDMLVGAGTVTSSELAQKAFDAGAAFIVAPGLNPGTVKWCIEHSAPVIPGVCTPTDVEIALGYGLDALKFFPAELTGGVKWLKAMAGPFPTVRFLATGGVNSGNAADYLAAPNCLGICGSYIAARDAIAARDWERITRNARQAMSAAKNPSGAGNAGGSENEGG